jgi:pSer/pThr/pTyr-binding forkhead associated (FHA) protein
MVGTPRHVELLFIIAHEHHGSLAAGAFDMADWFLIIESGDSKRRRVQLGVFPHVLGRHPHGDTGFESELISRRHAEIIESNGALRISDLGSTNGTSVNGDRIDESGVLLKPGDQITLGKEVVTLRLYSDEKTRIQTTSLALTGPIRIDRGARDVWVNEELQPPFPHKEFDVLALLVTEFEKFYGMAEIARAGWPERPNDVSDQEIQQIITGLRRRVAPTQIENRRNVGYRITA